MSRQSSHPTQLWISDPQTAQQKIIQHLQKRLCQNQGCLTCVTCQQIENKNHPWVEWIIPKRTYTLEQIDEVIQASSFQLDPQEQRFFIFEHAHCLQDGSANRLLKTIEEPHVGYNFYLLTDRPEALPATITSRCMIQKFLPQSIANKHHEFLKPFLNLEFQEPIKFIKQIEALDIKEEETKQLIDSLFEHWTTTLKEEVTAHSKQHKPASTMITILQQALTMPPMPGSTKIFWKNLYLTAHYALHSAKVKN